MADTSLFLLRSVWNPLPSELYDHGPRDLVDLASPMLFSSRIAAFAYVETQMAEDWERRGDEPEAERNRLLDDDGACWVYGPEDASLPAAVEEGEFSDFVFWYCDPIAVTA